ncbi:MAG: cysteine desulfurase [Alphaproteobacteria bacterium]|nr:cysteine desulfurase [Alphaproteobacteria bacterium]
MTSAYLDWNATTPLRPAAREAMVAAMDLSLGSPLNPSSVHATGREAKKRLERARQTVADGLGCAAADIVFTSGATEANSLALLGHPWSRVLVSAVEHDSVLAQRADAELIPVDGNGVVDLGGLAALLVDAPSPTLVSVMAVNNETGVVQPLADISAIVRDAGAVLHVDGAQAVGKMPFDLASTGADFASFSAHKLGGPAGVGALYANPAIPLESRLKGGGQEKGRRAGTENFIGIAGFAAALEDALSHRDWLVVVRGQRDRIEAEARRIGGNGLIVGGAGADRLPTTTSLAIPGLAAETQVMRLDLEGVQVSAGSACSSGKVKQSHVLAAMGHPHPGDAIRVSLGWETTADDVHRFLAAWSRMATGRFQGGRF